jgi:hypothetical protein
MNCAACGTALDSGSRFCGDCGAPVSAASRPEVPEAVPQPQTQAAPQMTVQQAPSPAQASAVPFVPASLPRAPVNPGICALLSLLWPGAGFFLLQKVGLALTVIFSVIAFDLLVNTIGVLMMGVGLVCTIPISIVAHIAVIIWTYRAAVAYNAGV